MDLFSFSYICLTNNPAMKDHVTSVELIRSSSLDVLKRARSLVHDGWELLSSPFYGNFKPNQQPYRTLLLRKRNVVGDASYDIQSISLIEDAVRFYESSHKIMSTGELDENIEKDFRYLDIVLMEETFRQYGVSAATAHPSRSPRI